MTKQRWLGILACAALVVGISIGAASCSKNKNSNPVAGTPDELNSGDIAPNASYAHKFMTAGTYNYHCIYHGVMTGTVTVTAGTPVVDGTVDIVSISPFPAMNVKVGATITWNNNTGATHTVTSD
jgi:plastocyanin